MLAMVSFRTYLLMGVGSLIVFFCVGYPSFHSCTDNGGSVLGCGLVAIFGGGLKTIIAVYVWFYVFLIDGLRHL
jgi:hypothetical protein